MKQKLLNLKRLRGLMLLAVMCVLSAGTAWAADVKDVIDNDATSLKLSSVATNNWVDFTLEGTSGATYQIHSMGLNGATHALQWNKNGYLYASKSGGIAKSITIKGNGKSVDVYASNTAYTAKATATKITSLTANETGATYEFTSDYAFIAINGTTSSTQITSIEIVWEEENQNLQESNLTLTSPSTISIAPEGTSQITYSTSSTGAITWTSMNPSIATVENGVVTGVETGTTIVTLEQAADANYKVGTASVVVKVVEDGEGVWNAGFTTKIENGLTLDFNADNITATYLKGNATTDPYSDNDEIRVYKDAKLTFAAPEGYEITNIVFTCTSNDYATALSKGTANSGTLTANSSSVTWTGVAQSIEINNSDAQARISKIVVTYGLTSEKQPSDFNITSPTAVDLILPGNPTATVTYTTSSTGTISWASADENVAKVANGVITAVAAGSTTISVSQAADANYEASEVKTITVNVTGEAASLDNIPALFNAATSTETDVTVTFNNWVVSGVSTNGKNVFVTDNEGNGFVIYSTSDMSGTFSAGNILSGTAVACDLVLYNGFAELKNLDASELTISSGGTVATANVAMADLSGVNTGALVSYENLTCSVNNSKYYLSDGTTQLQVYNSLFAFEALEDGKTYNITGVYQQYNNTKEILPRSAADIEEIVDGREDPEIAFTPSTITITKDEQFDQPTFSNPYNVSVSFDTTNADVASWNNGLELGSSTGTTTITATFEGDDDYLPATATLTVTVNENLHFADVVIGSGVYQKMTSMEELEAGKRYLIVYNDGVSEDAYVFGGITDKNIGSYKEGTISNNKIDNNTLAATPVVLQNASSGNWFIMEGDNYIAYTKPVGTTKNNNLFAVTSNVDGSAWAITETDITNAWNTERKLRFNTTNTQERFCAYLESGEQEDVILYKELPFTLNNYGYATLYYSDKAFIVPEGVTAKTYNESVEESTIYEAGDVIPANEAVVLQGTANAEVSFVVTTTTEKRDENNALKGLDEAGTTVGDGKFYMLSAKNGKVGFYYGAAEGAAFETTAHKAYLVIPASKAKEAYYLNDEVTGIQKIDNTLFSTDKIYNLNGQRVDKNYKGVVIVNGKKMINK